MRFASRYIPPASEPIDVDGLGTVYCYLDRSGRFAAVAYWGKQSKATWHHYFSTTEQRDAKIGEFRHSLHSHQTLKATRKVERNAPHTLKVGDIIVNSWGYDQTNIDFYAVVKTSEHFVWLHPVAAEGRETGFMCGDIWPANPLRLCPKKLKDETNAPPTQHKATLSGTYGNSVCFEFGCGHVWSGKTEHNSWYA